MALRILLSTSSKMANYVAAVEGCGAIAVAKYLPEVDTNYDGLILGGGVDVNPSFYGEEVNGSEDIDDLRDEAEMRLIKAFVDAGKPIMGICRGCQILNVFFGGSLIQHLDTSERHWPEGDDDNIHQVEITSDSPVRQLYGDVFPVNSAHHQAVKDLGKGLKVTMISEEDGVVEGIAHESLPIFAVQWHPERISFAHRREEAVDGKKIFEYFLEMCEKGRDEP